ncbi:MAG: zinc-finger domain-containing protein [Rickettsiaceae bacterium]|nr:zinc-finger domain-containing protein [Rickettsiaceae bacterium]
MPAEEIEKTTDKSVSCCGKEAPYDHPKVYLEIDPTLKKFDCPYCGKIFELE